MQQLWSDILGRVPRILGAADRELFINYVLLVDRLEVVAKAQNALSLLDAEGKVSLLLRLERQTIEVMTRLQAELGCTPASRTRLGQVATTGPETEFETILPRRGVRQRSVRVCISGSGVVIAMKRLFFLIALAVAVCLATQSEAVTCARGVYRAGCVGPNGAAVARRPATVPAYRAAPPANRPGWAVHCAAGVYRAGCVGPNGAAVVR
jgi:hypothetical protein